MGRRKLVEAVTDCIKPNMENYKDTARTVGKPAAMQANNIHFQIARDMERLKLKRLKKKR